MDIGVVCVHACTWKLIPLACCLPFSPRGRYYLVIIHLLSSSWAPEAKFCLSQSLFVSLHTHRGSNLKGARILFNSDSCPLHPIHLQLQGLQLPFRLFSLAPGLTLILISHCLPIIGSPSSSLSHLTFLGTFSS